MSALSPVLRMTVHGPMIWCPGCKAGHLFNAATTPSPRTGASWTWDGNAERPTFKPSMVSMHGTVKRDANGERLDPTKDDSWEFTPYCHSFVTDGFIQFLADCKHAMAGQTVPLPAWPGWIEGEQ